MVFVGVGEEHGFDPVRVVPQVGEVGEDEIDAGHVGVGEHDPAVDDEDAVVDLEAEAVAPDLAEPAEEDDLDRRATHQRQEGTGHLARRCSPGYAAHGRSPLRQLARFARSTPRAASGRRGSVLRHLVEGGVLLAGVDPVLELDDAELGEALAQPAVAGVEQAELLAVRHDLREQQRLEDRAVGRAAASP